MFVKKLAYLLILFLLWIMMTMYSFRVTAIVFYTFLFLPLPLWCLLKIQTKKVHIELILPERIVEKKELFDVGIAVKNLNRLPVGRLKVALLYRNMYMSGYKKKKIEFPLCQGTRKYMFTMSSDYSACLEFRIRSAKIQDIFGVFSVKKVRQSFFRRVENTRSEELVVLPQLHEMEQSLVRPNPYVLVESELYSGAKAGDDPAELFDIREYMLGDRLNRIHWKLSAKMDRFMVKEFGLPIDCSVLILADFSVDSQSKSLEFQDAVRETALSLSFRMVQEQQTHLFAWRDAVTGANVRYRVSDIEEFYEMAGCLLKSSGAWKKKSHKKPEEETAYLYFSEFWREQYTNIFYITAKKHPEEVSRYLIECRKSAWLRLIFLCGHPSEEELGLPVEGVFKNDLTLGELDQSLAMMVYPEGGAAWEKE